MAIRYTDGVQIEAHIGEIVRQADDLRSHVAVALDQYDAWPLKYHLAPERSNLMRPFSFAGLDVLELDAGMGAVSRHLAEEAASLTVVESKQERFDVLRERLRDLKNWRGQVANIQDVQLEPKFDVVCMIGVLANSDLYIKPAAGESPFTTFLKKASSFLKPGGSLVLAIENKLGLKYWSGSVEDHTARLFDGVVGYPLRKSPRTFSRRELLSLLQRAGFGQVDEFFPFPDYKIPSAILSRRLIETNGELAAEIAGQQAFRHYEQPPVKYFPDTLALASLAKAGLLADLANSFLFVASRDSKGAVRTKLLSRQLEDAQSGWYYSNQRQVPTQTLFRLAESDGGVLVEKRALVGADATRVFQDPALGSLRWHAIPSEPAAAGASVRSVLARCAYFDDWDWFYGILRAYLQWAFARWGEGERLRGEALDAIFANASLPVGSDLRDGALPTEFVVFDLEWTAESSLPKSWFVFRNVFNLVRDEQLLTSASGFGSFAALYERLCGELGVAPELDKDLDREAALQAVTSNQPDAGKHLTALDGIFRRPLPAPSLPRTAAAESTLRTDVSRLVEENARLHGMLASLPHKITEKLRRGASRVPGVSRALQGTVEPMYRLAKQTRRRMKEVGPTGWQPLSARPNGRFDLPRGLVTIPPQGFVKVEARGHFAGVESAELLLRFRGENDSVATLRVPFVLDSKRRARLMLRDPGVIEQLSVVLSPKGAGTVEALRVQPLSRVRAMGELCLPVVKQVFTEPAGAGALAAQGAKLLRPGKQKQLKHWLKEELFRRSVPPADLYTAWVEAYDALHDDDREAIRARIREWKSAGAELPLISVVMPVYNTDERWLRAAIDSVVDQLYPNWELCIADDCSPSPHVRAVLEEYRLKDPRIRVAYRTKNGHISAASNTALSLVSGEFVALLDHDDELAPHALYMVVEELRRHPQTDLVYSDEDKIDATGRRYSPHFKPDWNPELFYSLNLFTHLSVFRTSILRAIEGFRVGYEGSQDYDLTLRAIEKTSPERIRHIPHVLYHWRAIPGSVALASDEKTYAHEAARRAIRSHLQRTGVAGEVVEGFPPLHRVLYALPEPLPKVCAIICTRDKRELLEGAVSGLLEKTDYPNLEVLIVDNQSAEESTLEYFRMLKGDSRVRVLRYDAPFNFSAMNNFAAAETKADLLLFFNNDIQVIEPLWLKEMVRFAARPEFGAVGAKLLYANDTVQHAGVILGIGGVADHVHRFFPRRSDGYFGRAGVTMGFSAVTAACLLTRREVFEQVGGFDAEHLAVAYNDVDLCLRIGERGYRIVHTPFAELYHLESATRGSDQDAARQARFNAEAGYMKQRWGAKLASDPAYNPNLSLTKIDFSLAFPPRVTKPWRETPAAESRAFRPSDSATEHFVELRE